MYTKSFIESPGILKQHAFERKMLIGSFIGVCAIMLCMTVTIVFANFPISWVGSIGLGSAILVAIIGFLPKIFRSETFEFSPYTLVFREDGNLALDTKNFTHKYLVKEKKEFTFGETDEFGPVTWNYVELDNFSQQGSDEIKLDIDDELKLYDITVEIENPIPKEVIIGMCLNNPLVQETCKSNYSYHNRLVGFWIEKRLARFEQENMPDIVEAFSDEGNTQALEEKITNFFIEELKALSPDFISQIKIKIDERELSRW